MLTCSRYYFTQAGVENPVGIAQISYAIQLVGNIVSLFLVDRIGRRPMIVYGTIAITCLLLLIGGLGTLENNRTALQAVVGFMSFWGFLFQLTLGAVAYAVGGETPTARLRQKTYSINVMTNTAAACLVTQLVPILINPGNANLGAKVAFVFFAPSVPLSIYMYFCFPEMKGRSYLELETMFQSGLPARSFKNFKCEIEVATIAVDDGPEKPVAIVHDEDLLKV
ncbi:maltose permease [Alternaria alternata]|nr:maltose permease [Alternaria alternata]